MVKLVDLVTANSADKAVAKFKQLHKIKANDLVFTVRNVETNKTVVYSDEEGIEELT